jgi:ribose transport system substrate-binding protein
MPTIGLGPRGERAFPADKLILTEAEAEQARAGRFAVAIVLHTTTSDWSRQELAGIAATLERHDANVSEIVDCGFNKEMQNRALLRLAEAPVDAVISLPVGSSGVIEGHRAIPRAGKNLVLLDNAPPGLRPGVDYLSVISADNFGLGAIAAELTSPFVPNEGVAGILTYEAEFFVTNEREIAFRKWMGAERPDVTLVRRRFGKVEEAGSAYRRLLAENDDLDCVFVAWDVPALEVLSTIREGARSLPVITVDLGNEIAAELRKDGPLKGVAAQRPFDQGAAAASAALLGLIGRCPPAWVTSAGLKVTRENLREAYEAVWHAPATLNEIPLGRVSR